MIPVAGMLLLTLLLCTSVWAQSYDTGIHPQPFPAPTLPAAGGTFKDPTFGSTIIRVTDATNAPSGVTMMSDGEDMAWNAEGTLFILTIVGRGSHLFSFDRSTRAVTDKGQLNPTCIYDGAQWHPTEATTVFCTDVGRRIYKLTGLPTNPGQTPTLVHDFTPQIPAGGYSSARIGLSNTTQYVMLTASSLAGKGQDSYDYVSVWDTQTSTATTLYVPGQLGAGVYLHASDWVPGDTYVRLSLPTGDSVFWNWGANTFSASVTAYNNFSSHKSFGTNIVYNPAVGYGGPGNTRWLTRSMATPLTYSTLFDYPLKNSQHVYLWDSHGSRVLAGGAFTDDPQTAFGSTGWTWVVHSGSIWKVTSYSQQPGMNNPAKVPPDTGWYGTSPPMTLVNQVPVGAGQFFYDSGTDVLYAWLPDSSNPNVARNLLFFPWVPIVNEIVLNQPNGAGGWSTLRLCHHRARSNPANFYTYPLAHPDPQGRFVLFASNWDVFNGRIDAFIVDSQGGSSGSGSSGSLAPPSGLTVK